MAVRIPASQLLLLLLLLPCRLRQIAQERALRLQLPASDSALSALMERVTIYKPTNSAELLTILKVGPAASVPTGRRVYCSKLQQFRCIRHVLVRLMLWIWPSKPDCNRCMLLPPLSTSVSTAPPCRDSRPPC